MKKYVIDEHKQDNFVVRIFNDESPINPREDDNLGTMICFHSRYELGDEHNYSMEEGQELLRGDDIFLSLPLYLYDHSGITISTSPFGCVWDSMCVGFIYVTKEQVINEYGVIDETTIEKVTNVLEGEVETYDKYIRGDIYGFEIKKIEVCDKGCEHEEFVDSCWGYYDQDECMSEGKNRLEYYTKNEEVV